MDRPSNAVVIASLSGTLVVACNVQGLAVCNSSVFGKQSRKHETENMNARLLSTTTNDKRPANASGGRPTSTKRRNAVGSGRDPSRDCVVVSDSKWYARIKTSKA